MQPRRPAPQRRDVRRSPTEVIDMLGKLDAVANIAVRDIDAARTFYQGTLGLTPVGAGSEHLLALRSGASTIFVYRSDYAGTNQATCVTWPVGERMDEVVRALKAKGVRFEHYDMPGATRLGDVHVTGAIKVAWFKDPDGNILSLASG